MVSGSCEAARTPFLIRFTKSAYFISSLEGCELPGVISPIFFLCWDLTSLRDSAKSLSFDTIIAQSYRLDFMGWIKKLFEQSLKIQPLIGRIFYSAIIKIEPIYIDVGSQFT